MIEKIKLSGKVIAVLYSQKGFFIGSLLEDQNGKEIKICGNAIDLKKNDFIELEGNFEIHSKFGKQFKFNSFNFKQLTDNETIISFLATRYIKGVGESTARKIVNIHGAKTIDVIKNNPEALRSIKGISEERLKSLKESVDEYEKVRELMLFFEKYNVRSSLAMRIYNIYEHSSISQVKRNPYSLVFDIDGIGFKTADDIGKKMGFALDDHNRLLAGICYILMEETNGSTYLPYKELLKKVEELLSVSEFALELFLEKEEIKEKITVFDNGERIAFTKLYIRERYIASALLKRDAYYNTFKFENPERQIGLLEKLYNIELAEQQKEAILHSLKNNTMIISGGPGTGKTTIAKFIKVLYQKKGYQVFLTAPTGRASKRMTEVMGDKETQGQTIHRLLDFHPDQGFRRNSDYPLEEGLYLVDESSMIDVNLMYSLLRAMPIGATLIFIGDVFQLPSVGVGNVLADLINSGKIKTIMLDKIFRQAMESDIIVNSHKIKNQEEIFLKKETDENVKDFIFYEGEKEDLLKEIKKKSLRFRNSHFADFQILTPMKAGLLGTQNLNSEIQNILNPLIGNIKEKKYGDIAYREGDKVMQIKNNYDLLIFNGDVGVIKEINEKAKNMKIEFDSVVDYPFENLSQLALAYAVTIHKSQGSEFPYVFVVCDKGHYIMLKNTLFYTAVTRGKKEVCLFGQKKALNIAIASKDDSQRYTLLKNFLTGEKL